MVPTLLINLINAAGLTTGFFIFHIVFVRATWTDKQKTNE